MNPLALLVRLPVALASALAVADGASGDEAALAKLLERARAAHGTASFAASGRELVVDGTATTAGMDGAWTTRFAGDGRFATSRATELPSREGFDGKQTWRVDWTGVPRRSWFAERERTLLEYAVISGAWCLEGGPIVVLGCEPAAAPAAAPPAAAPAAAPVVRLRARDGEIEARLELDAKTSLPTRLHYEVVGVQEEWSFRGWHAVDGGLQLPGEFAADSEGEKSGWKLASAHLVAPDPAAFALPADPPRYATFDPALPARLVGHATRSGHLVVRTRLDGQEVGLFIFDSGAGSGCIDPDVADELGMPAFGDVKVGGVGAGRLDARFRRGKSVAIGPATVDAPVFVELQMDALGVALGEKLAGICGYDLLQRVVAVVDMKKGMVDLFDPATFTRKGVAWRDLVLAGNHPHVRCTFENDGEEEGLFRLDTGAGGASVLFHAPFVRKLGLLDKHPTTPSAGFGGVGGAAQARAGALDWFEIGGLTIDSPRVVFTEDLRGAFADPWTAGTIGSLFLERFDLVLDYPHGRIGFVAHE